MAIPRIPGKAAAFISAVRLRKEVNIIMENTSEFHPKSIPDTSDSTVDETSSNQTVYCSHCYKMVEAGTKFCPSCGKPIVGTLETPPASKTRKPIYKRWWFWTIIILFLLGSCGSSGDDAPNSKDLQTEIASKVINGESVSIEDAILFIESEMTSFENKSVYYKDEMFTIDIWQDGIASTAMLAIAGDGSSLEKWNLVVEAQESYSLNILTLLQNMGFENTPIVVNLLNDTNTDKILISVSNGVAFFDCVNDTLNTNHMQSVTETTVEPTVEATKPTNIIYDFGSTLTDKRGTTYVLNTSTMKFHRSSCSSVDEIKSSNKSSFTGTRAEVTANGYTPCERCDP